MLLFNISYGKATGLRIKDLIVVVVEVAGTNGVQSIFASVPLYKFSSGWVYA